MDSYFDALKRGLVGDPRIAEDFAQPNEASFSFQEQLDQLKKIKKAISQSLKHAFSRHTPLPKGYHDQPDDGASVDGAAPGSVISIGLLNPSGR